MALQKEDLVQVEEFLSEKGIHFNKEQNIIDGTDKLLLITSEGKGIYVTYEDILGSIGSVKGEKGSDGKDGTSFTTVIDSSNGNVFRLNSVDTILSCRVYVNTTEITDAIPEQYFNWKRESMGTELEDSRWNNSSKALGHKSVHITTEDCQGRTVFTCEVELGD